jgi:hypothetical protein
MVRVPAALVRELLDQIAYNRAYAPKYPAEDETSLEREQKRCETLLARLATPGLPQFVSNALQIAAREIAEAFDALARGTSADRNFDAAVDFLETAASGEPRRVDFIAGLTGEIVDVTKGGSRGSGDE